MSDDVTPKKGSSIIVGPGAASGNRSGNDSIITVGGIGNRTVIGGVPWEIETIGPNINTFIDCYQRYINRPSKNEGKVALKDMKLVGTELARGLKAMHDYMVHKLPIAAPDIHQILRARINETIEWSAFHMRYLTFMQLCQYFSAREPLNTVEKQIQKIQLIYEMHRMVEDLVELADLAPEDEEQAG